MEIKNVTIGYLKEIEKTGRVENNKTVYLIFRENIETKLCLVDNDYAYDINDLNNKYEIIKRDENHRIITDTNPNLLYALDVFSIEKEEQIKYKQVVKQYKKNKHKK